LPAVPNTESARKRVRQTARRQALNSWRKRKVKTSVKSFLAAIQERNVAGAEEEFRKVVSVLDRVSSTSTMHRNTAARRKSRLARRLNALRADAATN
jgi:small subunit ribosomal protein S20